MHQLNRGFSLMESLISLLVFSIGMLGLGQLQARLWVNSGDIHSIDAAYLVAANALEVYEIGPVAPRSASTSGFNYELSASSTIATTTVVVRVSWERPSGTDAITLGFSAGTTFSAMDARWLLPDG